MRVYLDNAATTPLSKEVLDAMMPYFTEHFGNPSTTYSYGRDTRAAIETARKTIASLLNAQPGEIIFTSGGTESANMAIKGAVDYLGVERIITSPVEHHCVEYAVDYCRDYKHTEKALVQIDTAGNIDLVHLENLLKASGKKSLVALMHANNEIGTMLNLKQVAEICKANHALFFSDTVQSFAHHIIDTKEISVDFVTGSAHKFHGPKGNGFLYMRKQNKVQALIHGGGQERGFRAGTENVAGIVGLAEAAKMAYNTLEEDKKHILGLKYYFKQQLMDAFEDIDFNGNTDEKSLFTVLNVSFPPHENAPLLLFHLDLAGICCSGGSACNSGAASGSHVIQALNKNPDRVSIRFSFSKHNTKEELDFVLEKLKEIFK